MNAFTLARTIRHYVGKAQTLRNERRAERFLNSLPAAIRKDIGWPDRLGGHCAPRALIRLQRRAPAGALVAFPNSRSTAMPSFKPVNAAVWFEIPVTDIDRVQALL